MVDSINLFQNGGGAFGGFRGFLEQSFGSNIGSNIGSNNRPLSGILDRNSVGLQSNPLQLPSNPLLQRIEQQKKNEKTDEEKKDEVELSNFVQEAAEEAVENARKTPGATSQVFVSEDGRFEVSVDLQVRRDGSFDLGLAVGFAQSSGAAIQSTTTGAIGSEQEQEQDESDVAPSKTEALPRSVPFDFNSNVSGSIERFTSYEQSLSTRDLQVDIFFEEAKSVAFEAEQRFGSESAEQFNAVAGQISIEFRLNINISGSDINNFNQAANDLLQFDNTGTLGGFLSAASNVLNSDSTNIGSFIDATRSLVGATQEHISSKLNTFFTGVNEQFGSSLEELGFQPNFLQNVGEDVENDLNSFFNITNDLLGRLAGSPDKREEFEDVENQEFNILQESLRELREQQQKEGIGFDILTSPERTDSSPRLVDQNQESIRELLESLEDETETQQAAEQPVDGEFAIA